MTDPPVALGELTLPSGTLAIVDPGHFGLHPAGSLTEVPVILARALPRDRVLPVVASTVADGRWSGLWDHIAVVVSDARVARSEPLGEALVDHARLLFADATYASHWRHEASIDGQADFVFWGRDAEALATATAAPALGEGVYGWRDLALEEARAHGIRAEDVRASRALRLATDFRPHSHHWQAMERVRASPTESATITVGPLTVCLAMTTWGDGAFPVYLDRDRDNAVVGVRVQLRTEAAEAAMNEVNP